VIRRLFAAHRVIVLVATIGLAQLSWRLWSRSEDRNRRRRVSRGVERAMDVLGIDVTGSQASIIVVVPIVAARWRGSSTAR
jgi:hypothetical protein